jgi:hypothetical protein
LVLLQRYGSAVRGVLDREMTFVAVGGMLLLVAGVMVLGLERNFTTDVISALAEGLQQPGHLYDAVNGRSDKRTRSNRRRRADLHALP